MDDLISREKEIESAYQGVQIQTAEKRGKWVVSGESYSLYKCSVCNSLCTSVGWASCISAKRMYEIMKYCPNCGAKMDIVL